MNPKDPPKGFRVLVSGELIQRGDLFRDNLEWVPSNRDGETPIDISRYARPVMPSPASPTLDIIRE